MHCLPGHGFSGGEVNKGPTLPLKVNWSRRRLRGWHGTHTYTMENTFMYYQASGPSTFPRCLKKSQSSSLNSPRSMKTKWTLLLTHSSSIATGWPGRPRAHSPFQSHPTGPAALRRWSCKEHLWHTKAKGNSTTRTASEWTIRCDGGRNRMLGISYNWKKY